jgi:hypothetical protein
MLKNLVMWNARGGVIPLGESKRGVTTPTQSHRPGAYGQDPLKKTEGDGGDCEESEKNLKTGQI